VSLRQNFKNPKPALHWIPVEERSRERPMDTAWDCVCLKPLDRKEWKNGLPDVVVTERTMV